MRLLFIICLLVASGITHITYACPVCERQQPKMLRGIVHGTGPESSWDYIIVAAIGGITVLTLFYSVKWLINPKETDKNHIKNFILNNE